MRRYLTRVFRLTGRATGIQQANQRTVTSAPVNIEVKSSAAPPGEENWTEPMSTSQLMMIITNPEHFPNGWQNEEWAWKVQNPEIFDEFGDGIRDPNINDKGWIIDRRFNNNGQPVETEVYVVVKIGDQWWMAENLKTKYFRDGTIIGRPGDQLDKFYTRFGITNATCTRCDGTPSNGPTDGILDLEICHYCVPLGSGQ